MYLRSEHRCLFRWTEASVDIGSSQPARDATGRTRRGLDPPPRSVYRVNRATIKRKRNRCKWRLTVIVQSGKRAAETKVLRCMYFREFIVRCRNQTHVKRLLLWKAGFSSATIRKSSDATTKRHNSRVNRERKVVVSPLRVRQWGKHGNFIRSNLR